MHADDRHACTYVDGPVRARMWPWTTKYNVRTWYACVYIKKRVRVRAERFKESCRSPAGRQYVSVGNRSPSVIRLFHDTPLARRLTSELETPRNNGLLKQPRATGRSGNTANEHGSRDAAELRCRVQHRRIETVGKPWRSRRKHCFRSGARNGQ